MALGDAFHLGVADSGIDRIIRDRNSKTAQALRELLGSGSVGGGGVTPEQLTSRLATERAQSDGRYVRTVNGVYPDSSGNVTVAAGGSTASVDTLSGATSLGRALMKADSMQTARAAINATTAVELEPPVDLTILFQNALT